MDAPAARPVRVSFVIPVYNEGATIGRLLDELFAAARFPFDVVVVYDFEEDNTLPAIRAHPRGERIRLVKNQFGRGALNAIRTGFAVAEGEAVTVLMGDASDDLRVLPRMVEQFCAGSDVVCGSRYSPGGGQIGGPRLKKLLSRAAGVSLHYLTGLPTRDATNSFKMYRASLLRAIEIESQGGFELAMEICIKAYLRGYRISEVPCVWRERTAGSSRFRLFVWLPHYLRWYFYALRRSWFGTRATPRGG